MHVVGGRLRWWFDSGSALGIMSGCGPTSFNSLKVFAYTGEDAFRDVLQPAIPSLTGFGTAFHRYGRLVTAPPSDEEPNEDLWTLYALRRVADMLLRPWQSATGADGCRLVGLAQDNLLQCFIPLGMEPIAARGCCPLFHEVVEVTEDASLGSEVVIKEKVWPGLMFGAMMFVRAGVRVRCSSAVMDAMIAGRTMLYFTYARQSRPVNDLSHGWGSNSQWRISFRRDYAQDGRLHYNVDGQTQLTSEAVMPGPEDTYSGNEDLTPAERIGLLTHRCFVRTAKPDRHRWPYEERYTEVDR